jgi:hypothetical protein
LQAFRQLQAVSGAASGKASASVAKTGVLSGSDLAALRGGALKTPNPAASAKLASQVSMDAARVAAALSFLSLSRGAYHAPASTAPGTTVSLKATAQDGSNRKVGVNLVYP